MVKPASILAEDFSRKLRNPLITEGKAVADLQSFYGTPNPQRVSDESVLCAVAE